MNSALIIAASVAPSFLMGYGLRKFTLKWENKASSAKAEADLQAEQLAATVSASLDGIIIIDADGKVVEFSESAERIFGYKKEDIVGQEMANLIVPERYREAHNTGMSRMRETGQANILGQRIEIEALRSNGEEFMSELAISRTQGPNGNIFIAYIRDISEAKAAEKALRDAKDSAELANRAKTQFISSMSHEIRTPFNAVLGILDILGDTKLSDDQKQLVQTAERTSQSLLRIINDVLDYARISSGSVKIVKEAFHAPDVFDDVYRLFAMQAKDRGNMLSINSLNAEDIYLAGDIGRIRQILMNFVSNAIKYTKGGNINLVVETRFKKNKKYSLICKVKDNGHGIDKEKQNHLFDEFYMAEDIDVRATEGTGLGLTICKVLTKMMRGHIGVESEVGSGSIFWIDIPLEKTEPTKNVAETTDIHKDIQGRKILLAEDNPTNRMVVSRILEKQGAILTVATNGIEALASLETSVFDLLLTDIFMPEMGGKELVRRLRSSGNINAKIPIIALTAMGDIHEAEELLPYGFDQVVLKPFNSKDLISEIAEHCSAVDDAKEGNEDNSEERDLDLLELPFDENILDIKMAGGLLEGLNENDLKDIKHQFRIDLQDVTRALQEAIASENIAHIKTSSHTLKGLAGIYGLSILSEAAALTNYHCFHSKVAKVVGWGRKAIQIAEIVLLNLDDLFVEKEEAA